MSQPQLVKNAPIKSEGQTRVLTLDELCTNPDDPRKSRNPRYDDIKASIRACGLKSVPFVTLDPRLPAGMWTFSDGGNTRYTIMRELWNETGDERFFRMLCVVKPWPGRFQCLTGHLAENETHGQLTFIDKALSVHDARSLLEEERGKKVSLRELASELTANGLPVHFSSVSRMEDVVQNLYPWLPVLLKSGFGGQGLRKLLKLRHSAEAIWEKYRVESDIETEADFPYVFGECCRKFDDPELWSFEMFTDELIGDLTAAFPCPELDYDGWLLELRGASKVKEEDAENTSSDITPHLPVAPCANDDASAEQDYSANTYQAKPTKTSMVIDQADSLIEPAIPSVLSGNETPILTSAMTSDADQSVQTFEHEEPLEVTALSDTDSLWHINALQDDIDHLQSIAWRLCWDVANAHGCCDALESDNENALSAGFRLSVHADNAPAVACFLSSLAGEATSENAPHLFSGLLIGLNDSTTPTFDDEQTLTVFRLIRILRRLRELQRKGAAHNVPVNEG